MSRTSEAATCVEVLDPAQRRYRIRLRFRAMARLAYTNRAWLREEDLEKRRSYSTVGRRFTLAQKAILNKQACYRTEQEIENVYKFITFLKAVRKYPEEIQRLIAGVTYYAYYEAKRIIVKQNHVPMGMYFIAQGECEKFSTHYDKILDEDVVNYSAILRDGDSFGDNSLLHEVPRSLTVRTLTPCHILILKAEDFNLILRERLQKEWQTLIEELNKFTYFDDLSILKKRECYGIAKICSVDRGVTILEKDSELEVPYVHFVLRGECALIEDLLVHENLRKGVLQTKLFTYKEEDDLKEEYESKQKKGVSWSTIGLSRSNMELTKSHVNISQGVLKTLGASSRAVDNIYKRVDDIRKLSFESNNMDDTSSAKVKPITSGRFLPTDVQTHFIKVCTFSTKACFNLGENMRRRCIVAITDVRLMLIPRYWIMGSGYTNKWDQVKNYLNRQIPTSEQVFKEFIEKRKFRSYEKDYVSNKKTRHVNCVGNIPYTIRIRKDFDYTYVLYK